MIAAFAIGLRVKKETIGEIAAAAQVMREFATPVEVADKRHLVDIVGTGGDSSHTFNISTAAVFVAAAAGARVAKHAKYRASPGYLAKHARHEAIRYARRVAVAVCLSCPLPAAPGRRRCVGCLATYAAHQQVYEMRREESRAA